jgi:hypothetical protein
VLIDSADSGGGSNVDELAKARGGGANVQLNDLDEKRRKRKAGEIIFRER